VLTFTNKNTESCLAAAWAFEMRKQNMAEMQQMACFNMHSHIISVLLLFELSLNNFSKAWLIHKINSFLVLVLDLN